MWKEKMAKIFPVFHVKHDKQRNGKKRTGAPERRSGPLHRREEGETLCPDSAPAEAKRLPGESKPVCRENQIRIMPSRGGTEICR